MPKRSEGVKSPFVEHIAATLEHRIRTGTYRGGRWLPTERELCTEFAVSRATLRQALVELERSSLVVRAAGCRPFVRTDIEISAHEAGAFHDGGRTEAARHTIGLCVKHDPKYSGTYQITQGVREAANTDSIRLIVGGPGASTQDGIEEEEARTLLRMVRDEDIRAIVLWYCGGAANVPILGAVQEAGISVVFVDREPPGGMDADFVGIDNQRAACEAVQYLVQRGHRRIAHVTNPERVSPVSERMAGYREAILEAGIAFDESLVFTACRAGMAESGDSPEQIADRLIAHPAHPTAVFAVTDYIALALVGALRDRGKRVPQDVAIVGFDDLEQWFPQKPFLTTVRQPFDRIGSEAVRLQIRRFDEGQSRHHSRHIILDAPLIVRESA